MGQCHSSDIGPMITNYSQFYYILEFLSACRRLSDAQPFAKTEDVKGVPPAADSKLQFKQERNYNTLEA